MILSIIAVGNPYIDYTINSLDRLIENNYDIKILTDQPHKFKNKNVEVYHYEKKLFSYFDKIIFPLQLSEKYKIDVLYIDSDMLCKLSDKFIKNFKGGDSFLYYENWPYGETFKDYKHNQYFKLLLDYFHNKKITEYDNLITILEWVYYFPYLENKTTELLIDIETIKPVFEYMSIIFETGYTGIGNAEGMGLSFVLNKNKVPIQKYVDLIFEI